MNNSAIQQDQINKVVWNACDTFRGTVDPSIYKDYVLTMLFVKYLSDVWEDHREQYEKEHGDNPELIVELMKNERFVLPPDAGFYALHERRHEPGNGERIDRALHAIEEANTVKLADVFQDIACSGGIFAPQCHRSATADRPGSEGVGLGWKAARGAAPAPGAWTTGSNRWH